METSAIDLRYLKELAEIAQPNPEIYLNKLITLFKKQATDQLKAIADVLQSQNHDQLTKVIHNLKSTCHGIGAQTLALTAAQLETSAHTDKEFSASYWNDKLNHEFTRTTNCLDEILEKKLY